MGGNSSQSPFEVIFEWNAYLHSIIFGFFVVFCGGIVFVVSWRRADESEASFNLEFLWQYSRVPAFFLGIMKHRNQMSRIRSLERKKKSDGSLFCVYPRFYWMGLCHFSLYDYRILCCPANWFGKRKRMQIFPFHPLIQSTKWMGSGFFVQ